MTAPVHAINFKIRQALYTSKGAITFRAFSNRLVNEGTLSDEQLDQHHTEIAQLFHEWRTGLQAQSSEHNPQPPMSPQTPESLLPQTKDLTSSSPEDARTATTVEIVKEAMAAIIADGELIDPRTACLYLPNDMNHESVPVAMKKSSCSLSFITAWALDKNEIEWEGNHVILRWRVPGNGNEDQSVQRTCFVVVEKEVASQTGFHFDMLVGVDHHLPLQNQVRAPGSEEASSADSSVIDQTDDLSTHSFEDTRSAELRPLPVTRRSPRPATATVSFSGSQPGSEMASFFNSIRDGGDVVFRAIQRSGGRLIESQRHGSGKRKLSYSDSSEGPSRKNR